ncbi:MAG: hypothetical protein ACTTHX_08190 [Moraxella sp.]
MNSDILYLCVETLIISYLILVVLPIFGGGTYFYLVYVVRVGQVGS